jgi:hypothetical protein
VKVDFAKDGTLFVADEQPAFVLQPGMPTHWRSQAASAPTSRP